MQISAVLSKVKNHVLEQVNPDNRLSGFEENSGRLSDQERIDWLRLIRSENVGPITFYQLINRYGSAANALEALPALSRKGGSGKPARICTTAQAEAELEHAQRSGTHIIAFGEAEYPPLLENIEVPPPILFMKGDFSLVSRPVISIVGSRNGSASGRQLTKMIASELGQLGYVIASGLARGIDTAAHEAALNTGTIAVVAGGIDIIYPPENEKLQKSISEQGIIISENPPGFKPRGKDFPRRNRIISGLANAVLVIEAALRSGSLITARYALEHNRELFAVPGHPLDPRAEGTNSLIKKGANMLTCADDVTEVLAPMLRTLPLYMKHEKTSSKQDADENTPATDTSHEERQKIMIALGPTPTDIDELIRCTGLQPSIVHTVLIELDLAGRLERHGSQKVSLVGSSDRQGNLF